MNYRSKVSHTLKGTADWEADGADAKRAWDLITKLGYVPNEKPASKSSRLSLYPFTYVPRHRQNQFVRRCDLTRHSRFNKAELVFENNKSVINGKRDRTVITPNWRNTYKVASGGSYQLPNHCNCVPVSLSTNRRLKAPKTA